MHASTCVNNVYVCVYFPNWNHDAYSFVFYFLFTLVTIFHGIQFKKHHFKEGNYTSQHFI